jgi:hypothetical protein
MKAPRSTHPLVFSLTALVLTLSSVAQRCDHLYVNHPTLTFTSSPRAGCRSCCKSFGLIVH